MRALRFARIIVATLALGSALAHGQSPGDGRKRVALVIGNAAYAASALRNATNDATDMAAALSSLGFSTRIHRDATSATMRAAIARFGADSVGAEAAVFYFAGHAVQSGTTVKLAGVEESPPRLADPVPLEEIFRQVREAKPRFTFVVLDSARTSDGDRPPIGDPPAPPDTLVAYATSSGDIATDGFGRNGTYTARLLQEISVPGATAEQVFKRVREAVVRDTRGAQTPIDSSRLRGEYYFVSAPPSAPAPASVVAGSLPPRFRLAPPPGEVRVALVIGNGSYETAPLSNPPNDAEDMARSLGTAGFKVILRKDQGYREMRAAVREFGAALKGATVGLFYFAGHGLQINGRNYLVPVQADIQSEADAEDLAIDANYVLATMEQSGSKVNVMILDACRNNPYSRGFRSATLGLAPMQAGSGMVIAFATAPGSQASDGGRDRNGLYTKHLLSNLEEKDTDILKVFQRTRAAVVRETRGRQIPWESTSLIGDFHFRIPIPVP